MPTPLNSQVHTVSETFPPVAPLVAASGNVAAAAAAATLTPTSTKTAYLGGIIVTGLGATGGAAALLTITGLLGGTITLNVGVPAGVAVPLTPHVFLFPEPLAASAVNTAIVCSCASFGAGNTAASLVAWGKQL